MKPQVILLFFCGFFMTQGMHGQTARQVSFPVRGFAIAAPTAAGLDSFVVFITRELVPRKVNTLILRIDYKYQFRSRPELVDSGALSAQDVKKLVEVCKRNRIHLIPQINLLGHQSWASGTGKLLQVYPQFDETPHITMPAKYVWPNADSLYCKSYCPLHPEVHDVVFDLVDEICDVFETDAFHAGMDEVFFIGHEKCPRCSGKNKAELYASEVITIQKHLNIKKRKLWLWGDRLLDGNTTGVGMWEGSMNNTHPAIKLIPKDVVICDWHYEKAEKTPVFFAQNGFKVITCSWQKPQVAVAQVNDMAAWRQLHKGEIKNRYAGVMETVWSSASVFLNGFYSTDTTGIQNGETPWHCFRAMFDQVEKVASNRQMATR